jgi:hypothetical protein
MGMVKLESDNEMKWSFSILIAVAIALQSWCLQGIVDLKERIKSVETQLTYIANQRNN